jgi:hypothetical protein
MIEGAKKAGFFSPIRIHAAIAKTAKTQVASPACLASVPFNRHGLKAIEAFLSAAN